MGSSRLRQIVSKTASTDAINDWLNDIRSKKFQMKRRRCISLRVSAILTSAIIRAEDELRRKQNERLAKWSQMKMKLMYESGEENNASSSSRLHTLTEQEEYEKQVEIQNLWNGELNELNSFMNNLNQVKTVVVR